MASSTLGFISRSTIAPVSVDDIIGTSDANPVLTKSRVADSDSIAPHAATASPDLATVAMMLPPLGDFGPVAARSSRAKLQSAAKPGWRNPRATRRRASASISAILSIKRWSPEASGRSLRSKPYSAWTVRPTLRSAPSARRCMPPLVPSTKLTSKRLSESSSNTRPELPVRYRSTTSTPPLIILRHFSRSVARKQPERWASWRQRP